MEAIPRAPATDLNTMPWASPTLAPMLALNLVLTLALAHMEPGTPPACSDPQPLSTLRPPPSAPPPSALRPLPSALRSWRQQVYGNEPEKMVLSRRLQRWACLWKVDVVFNVLCLLAVWAFLFKGWSNLQAVGVSVALLSNLSCSAALYWAVRLERPKLTLWLQLLAALQPAYLVYQSVDIVVRSDAFPYAWPSVMIPTFLLASLVRLLLMISSCGVARTVFGHGLKGKNPLAAAHEHLLPRALRSRLRQRKDLQDALRLCMRGQQLRCSGLPSGPAAGASAGAAQLSAGAAREADLRTSFVQLCVGADGELEQLSLPWLGVALPMACLLHVQSHGAAGSAAAQLAPAAASPSQPPPQPHSAAPHADAEAAADRLSFTLWYLDGEQPLQMRFVTHDEHSLWSWVHGLRAALPPRALDPP